MTIIPGIQDWKKARGTGQLEAAPCQVDLVLAAEYVAASGGPRDECETGESSVLQLSWWSRKKMGFGLFMHSNPSSAFC